MTDLRGLAGMAHRRAATYWLLARLVHESPTGESLQALHATLGSQPAEPGTPLAGEVAALGEATAAVMLDAEGPLALRIEHTRLWSGLSARYGPPPPYESVFREGKLPGDATTAVALAYEQAGLDPEVADAGPADHVANELRFLALCCNEEARAWLAGDEATAAEWLDRERSFLDDHVLAWIPDHCEVVAQQAATDYHRGVARLVAGACRLDRRDLAELLAESVAVA